MIYTYVQHSNIYNDHISNTEKSTYYYSCLLALLKDIKEQGIILIDSDRNHIKRLSEFIKTWPNEYKKQAQELLKCINNKSRFIEAKKLENSTFSEIACAAYTEDCSEYYSMKYNDADIVLSLNGCNSMMEFGNTEIVEIDKYTCSDFYLKKKKNGIIISYGYKTEQEFYDLVLNRIFKYSTSIIIIDRVLGHHIAVHPGNLSSNFKTGLKYIAKSIKQASEVEKEVIELYTTLKLSKEPRLLNQNEIVDIKATIRNVEEFIDELNKEYSLNMKCIFVYDKYGIRHDRYIITNQIAVQIGRGTDIIDEHYIIRDNTISVIDNAGSIVSTIKTLKEIRSIL